MCVYIYTYIYTHTHTHSYILYLELRITILSVGLQILVLPHCTWKPCIQFEDTRFTFLKLDIHFNENYLSPARALLENTTCGLKHVQSLTWTSVENRLVEEDYA